MFYVIYPEKDVNGDTLWVWCYPSVGSDLRQVLLRKCCLTQDGRDFHTFVFGQFCRTWYYITTLEVQEPTALSKVQSRDCSYSDEQGRATVQHLCIDSYFSFRQGYSFFNSYYGKRLQPGEVCGPEQNTVQVHCEVHLTLFIQFSLRCFFTRVSGMFVFILQDVHQTWQPGKNDGGLCHRPHQRNLPE